MTEQAKEYGNRAAFAHGNPTHGGDSGLTKREWFAGMAMQGMDANPDLNLDPTKLAECAFTEADAMIERSLQDG